MLSGGVQASAVSCEQSLACGRAHQDLEKIKGLRQCALPSMRLDTSSVFASNTACWLVSRVHKVGVLSFNWFFFCLSMQMKHASSSTGVDPLARCLSWLQGIDAGCVHMPAARSLLSASQRGVLCSCVECVHACVHVAKSRQCVFSFVILQRRETAAVEGTWRGHAPALCSCAQQLCVGCSICMVVCATRLGPFCVPPSCERLLLAWWQDCTNGRCTNGRCAAAAGTANLLHGGAILLDVLWHVWAGHATHGQPPRLAVLSICSGHPPPARHQRQIQLACADRLSEVHRNA